MNKLRKALAGSRIIADCEHPGRHYLQVGDVRYIYEADGSCFGWYRPGMEVQNVKS